MKSVQKPQGWDLNPEQSKPRPISNAVCALPNCSYTWCYLWCRFKLLCADTVDYRPGVAEAISQRCSSQA